MDHYPDIREKYTERLLDSLNVVRDEDQLDVIVWIKDPDAPERRPNGTTHRIGSARPTEKQHVHQIMEDFVNFVCQLEKEGADARLEGRSLRWPIAWVAASPPILELLSKRSDVDRIDVNGEVRLIP